MKRRAPKFEPGQSSEEWWRLAIGIYGSLHEAYLAISANHYEPPVPTQDNLPVSYAPIDNGMGTIRVKTWLGPLLLPIQWPPHLLKRETLKSARPTKIRLSYTHNRGSWYVHAWDIYLTPTDTEESGGWEMLTIRWLLKDVLEADPATIKDSYNTL